MKNNEILLTKTLLRDVIVSVLSENKLGFNFVKSNYRHYYFQREAKYRNAFDFMIITVYLEKGYINCELQSKTYKSKNYFNISSGILNRRTFLFNSQSESKFGPYIWQYYFKKDIESLKSTLTLVMADLHTKGKEFIDDCDNRYLSPKFLCGSEFIENLTVCKEDLSKIFPKHFNGCWWKLDHDKFRELEFLFNQIDKENSSKEEDNSVFVYEFLDKYVNQVKATRRR